MKGEDDRLIPGEEHIEVLVAESVRVLALRLERHPDPPVRMFLKYLYSLLLSFDELFERLDSSLHIPG